MGAGSVICLADGKRPKGGIEQRDVLSLYEVRGESLFKRAFYMYGHKRLGYLVDERYLGRFCSGCPCLPRDFTSLISDRLSGLGRPSVGTLGEEVGPPLPDLPARWGRAWVVGDVAELRLGARRYELSDWLGNVRVVVTDRRVAIRGNNQVVVGYRAEVVEVRDYYLIEVMTAPSIPIATPSMVRKTLGKSGGNPRETSFQRFGKGRRPQNIGSMMDVLELARQAKARTSMVEVDRLRPLSVDSLPMDVSSNLITPMETLNQE